MTCSTRSSLETTWGPFQWKARLYGLCEHTKGGISSRWCHQVWDIQTGKLEFEFRRAHQASAVIAYFVRQSFWSFAETLDFCLVSAKFGLQGSQNDLHGLWPVEAMSLHWGGGSNDRTHLQLGKTWENQWKTWENLGKSLGNGIIEILLKHTATECVWLLIFAWSKELHCPWVQEGAVKLWNFSSGQQQGSWNESDFYLAEWESDSAAWRLHVEHEDHAPSSKTLHPQPGCARSLWSNLLKFAARHLELQLSECFTLLRIFTQFHACRSIVG